MKSTSLTNSLKINPEAATVAEILQELETHQDLWLHYHTIVDLSEINIAPKDFKKFSKIQKAHNKRKKSFVMLAPNADFNEIDESLAVVPSLQEALDVIEMEEIERDLGF